MRRGAMALALLGVAGAAQAATDPASWVRRILSEYDQIQVKQGWAPQGEARPGALASGEEAIVDFDLAAGATYRFVVVCESACGAGEVELLDPSGTRVGDLGALVEMPKLPAAPTGSGRYKLRVAMTDCATAACAWSARLYAKR